MCLASECGGAVAMWWRCGGAVVQVSVVVLCCFHFSASLFTRIKVYNCVCVCVITSVSVLP
jgi:heme/copper-type cytochrome/quinol oxidase subunit 4